MIHPFCIDTPIDAFAGTLTKNEMTVTHMYAVDDLVDLTPFLQNSRFSTQHPDHPNLAASSAILKAAFIGNICNNAFRNESGLNVGQATEVALLNILPVLAQDDERKVCWSKKTDANEQELRSTQ